MSTHLRKTSEKNSNSMTVVCFRSGSSDRSMYDQFIDSTDVWRLDLIPLKYKIYLIYELIQSQKLDSGQFVAHSLSD